MSGSTADGRAADPAGLGNPPVVRRLTRAEMEAAALEGRQIGGQLDAGAALRLLQSGEMEVVGRLLEASNATFYCLVLVEPEGEGAGEASGAVAGAATAPPVAAGSVATISCVYKPIRGERPLVDFPDGTLACREVGAFAISEATGWEIVPPTVMRDGPFGPGMVQLWVETDRSVDLAELVDGDLPQVRRIALLDAVLNNADRKGGHLLPLPDGRIQAIDNGLSFAVEPKLRTILWRWRGQLFEPEERAVLEKLAAAMHADLGERLQALLSPQEVRATARRIETLLSKGRFPLPDRDRPVIPWPPF